MMTSNLPVRRAGIIPDHFVGTNSTLTPMSFATRLATSISKPMSYPVLSFMAQGTNVDMPTRSTPRLSTCSMVLSEMSCCCIFPANALLQRAKDKDAAIMVTMNDDLPIFMNFPPFKWVVCLRFNVQRFKGSTFRGSKVQRSRLRDSRFNFLLFKR